MAIAEFLLACGNRKGVWGGVLGRLGVDFGGGGHGLGLDRSGWEVRDRGMGGQEDRQIVALGDLDDERLGSSLRGGGSGGVEPEGAGPSAGGDGPRGV